MSQSNNDRVVISQVNPKSPISEAYRALRTNIQFSAADEEIRVVMITSAGPGEGKSTTVSNLAVTYAQADQKVLVLEADLRKPTVHKMFQQTNRTGITNVMTNQATLNDVIRKTHIPNLHVITSGPIPPNPSEILGSKKMQLALEELKELFDIIIIDTPPVLAITDAQVVATNCDGVILVLDSGRVKRDAAIKAKANLEHVNARILGVVLNNVKRGGADSYYYYYYGNDD